MHKVATCPLCEAACGVVVEVDDGRIRSIRGNDDDVLSRGYICPKAAALTDLHYDPDRLRAPVIREGSGFAFPSGHTTGALVIYGALLLILLGSRYRRRPATIAACALAVAGLAGAAVGRVVLGAHWPTDVLGAALLSGCWLIALHWADRRWLAPRWLAPQSTAPRR